MKKLTAAEILSASDIERIEVDVPEWGGTVTIAVMSGKQRDSYEQQLSSRQGTRDTVDNLRALYLSHCLVDDACKLLFTQADIAALGEKSGTVLGRLFNEAIRINALGLEGMEDIAKNS